MYQGVPHIAAHRPTAGAIDGKKSSGSAQIVELGFRGPVMRLSIYNVIGYRLGLVAGRRHRCARPAVRRQSAVRRHRRSSRAAAQRRPATSRTDWLFRHRVSISVFIIITTISSSSSSSSSVASVSHDCQHVAGTLSSYEPRSFDDVH